MLHILTLAAALTATAPTTESWRVAGLQAVDTLNLRERPSMASQVMTRIPYDARGLKSLGVATDTNGKPLASAKSKKPYWCGVEFLGHSGWVACQYLVEDD